MLKRHCDAELVCVHDGNFWFPPNVNRIRMPDEVAALPDYLPKLWAWSRDFHSIIGQRFASIDLDVVLLGDFRPLLSTNDPILIWDAAKGEPYNSSLFALEPGSGTEVWNRLSPAAVEEAKRTAGYWTGDQSWVAHVLGDGVQTFGEADGVIRYRPSLHRYAQPEGKAVFFCGPYDPMTERGDSEWIDRNWL